MKKGLILILIIVLILTIIFTFFRTNELKFTGGTFQIDPARSSDQTPLREYKDDADRVTFLSDGNFVWSIYHGHWLQSDDLIFVDHLFDPQGRDLVSRNKYGSKIAGVKFFRIISNRDLKEILDPSISRQDSEKEWYLWLHKL